MSGPALIRLAALCAALGALAPAASAETLDLPHGLSVQLPEGWVVDGSPQGEVSRSGMRRVQLVCESEACEQTQETCTLLMQAKPLEGDDDDARLQALYASPLKRYFRLRAVLRATSPDADIRQPLERVRIGDRDWYRSRPMRGTSTGRACLPRRWSTACTSARSASRAKPANSATGTDCGSSRA